MGGLTCSGIFVDMSGLIAWAEHGVRGVSHFECLFSIL